MTTDVAAVAAVLDRMRGSGAGLPYGDGVAVFSRVYVSVTEEVARRLAVGAFADRVAAEELAVRFAGRFLAAVADDAAGRRPPACWRPLFRMRRHPGVRPLQFALAGINAHVGHDLALAVLDTCRATGRELPELEADFDRVGAALTAIEERVREELMPGPDLLEVAEPLTHVVGSWSLARARDAAWAAARLLWALRGVPAAYDECVSRLDAGVGLVGRLLLTPVGGSGGAPGGGTGPGGRLGGASGGGPGPGASGRPGSRSGGPGGGQSSGRRTGAISS